MMHSENIKFYLHSPKSAKTTSIYAKDHLKGEKVNISIGHKNQPDFGNEQVNVLPQTKSLSNVELTKKQLSS